MSVRERMQVRHTAETNSGSPFLSSVALILYNVRNACSCTKCIIRNSYHSAYLWKTMFVEDIFFLNWKIYHITIKINQIVKIIRR